MGVQMHLLTQGGLCWGTETFDTYNPWVYRENNKKLAHWHYPMEMDGQCRRTHEFLIPNSIHNPSGQNLLSPQHWAKHTGDGRDTAVSGSTTTEQDVTLFWGNRKYRKTIPLTQGSNVADLHTAPSYEKYKDFLVQAGCVEGEDAINDDAYSAIQEDIMGTTVFKGQDAITMKSILDPFKEENFHPSQANLSSTQTQMLQTHKNLGHVSFERIRELSRQGQLPKKYL